jgi:hypothetical protein
MPDMPDDRYSPKDDAILAVGGILFVGASASGRNRIRLGPAAGWMVPRGIALWERELSFVERAGMTQALASALRATLADQQIAPKRFPTAKKAVEASPLLALSGNLVDDARAQGVRVHTVGVDRVSGDFYYFEEGGGRDPVRVQGNLVEMLAPSLGPSSTNADIAARLEGLLDRLLLSLSGGVVSELAVELADALPRLSRDGTGLEGTDLVALELEAAALAARSTRWDAGARRIPQALEEATRKGLRSVAVPLFGEARQETTPSLEVLVDGKTRTLPGPAVWTVAGAPREEAKPSPSPVPARPIAGSAPARVSPTPIPARPSPSPSAPRVSSSPTPARPSPSPSAPRVSPSPIPARPSPVPATPSRVIVLGPDAPAAVKPSPMRVTPIPPRPEPAPAAPAAASPTLDRKQANDRGVEALAPADASPQAAPAPAPAPAPESAPESALAPESAPESAPAASSTTTTTRPPRNVPATKSSSSSTLFLALLALAALAYVAFERFVH